jgi:hypothetical protein
MIKKDDIVWCMYIDSSSDIILLNDAIVNMVYFKCDKIYRIGVQFENKNYQCTPDNVFKSKRIRDSYVLKLCNETINYYQELRTKIYGSMPSSVPMPTEEEIIREKYCQKIYRHLLNIVDEAKQLEAFRKGADYNMFARENLV